MFIVSLTYLCQLSEIDKHLADHVQFLDKQYAEGTFIASGKKVPRIGGIIIARAESRAELMRCLEQDPFHQLELAAYEVTEFIPTKVANDAAFLLE